MNNLVFLDLIICLEDRKKLMVLKRHLKTSHNMKPAEYFRRITRWLRAATRAIAPPPQKASGSVARNSAGCHDARASRARPERSIGHSFTKGFCVGKPRRVFQRG